MKCTKKEVEFIHTYASKLFCNTTEYILLYKMYLSKSYPLQSFE